MKKFVCPVCGYVYEGEFIPEGFECPVCGVDGSKFKVMEEGKLAAEHEMCIRDSLDTGHATLYKWGAAPSWLLRRGSAEKIGTATPPPGISVTDVYKRQASR